MHGVLPYAQGGKGHRQVLSVFLAVICFFLAAIAIRSVELGFPPFRTDALFEKLDYYKNNSHKYDVVFLGSSHIAYAVMPSIFDEKMKEEGCPVKSFNLAIPSYTTSIFISTIRHILEAKNKPGYIFYEPLITEERVSPRHIKRSRYSFRMESLRDIILLLSDKAKHRTRIFKIIKLYLYFNLGGGALHNVLFSPPMQGSFFKRNQGFQEMVKKYDGALAVKKITDESKKEFIKRKMRLTRGVDDFKVNSKKYAIISKKMKSILTIMRKWIDPLGIKNAMIYVLDKPDKSLYIRKSLGEEKKDKEILFDYHPVNIPAIYRRRLWRDDVHLNIYGARKLSKRLAKDICAKIKEGKL